MARWTIEPHGDGYALYVGRDEQSHGWRILNISDVDKTAWPAVKKLIEKIPLAVEAMDGLPGLLREAGQELATTDSVPDIRAALYAKADEIEKLQKGE